MNKVVPGTLLAVREGRMGKTVILIFSTDTEETERLTLSRQTYMALGAPAVGTCPDDKTRLAMREASERRAALGTALRILECGDTTRLKLREKLTRRGFSEAAIDAALGEVIKRGYIDEGRTAARQVLLCAEKGWGKRKIHAYLVTHGIPSEIAADAIKAAEESGEVDFVALKKEFIEARIKRGWEHDAILRALWRAGF